MFIRYSLRSTDVVTARRFYADVLGRELPDGPSPSSDLESWPLHEQARARGVPSHWLGHVATADLEGTLARLDAAGAQRLSPILEVGGARYATLRDPFGAVIAVRSGDGPRAAGEVAWHHLHSADAAASWALYRDLFGWVDAGAIDVPDPEGGHQLFAFRAGGPTVGSVANTGRWAGVHPHWQLYFPVPDLPAAIERVRALGGLALDPVALPDGRVLAACDDPQGAAFGLTTSSRAR